MLRAINRQQIAEILEISYFGAENYSVDYTTHQDAMVSIQFLSDHEFKFELVQSSGVNSFICVEKPGVKFLAAERFGVASLSVVLHRINDWTERIREELISTNPFAREISDLRSHIDKRLADIGEDLNGFFSRDEAKVMEQRLSEFSERLSEVGSKNTELVEAINALKKTVEDIQGAVSNLNRGTWYRMTGGRLLSGMKAFAKSKEAREFALEATKKLLLEK